jgi:hypothetical protein
MRCNCSTATNYKVPSVTAVFITEIVPSSWRHENGQCKSQYKYSASVRQRVSLGLPHTGSICPNVVSWVNNVILSIGPINCYARPFELSTCSIARHVSKTDVSKDMKSAVSNWNDVVEFWRS